MCACVCVCDVCVCVCVNRVKRGHLYEYTPSNWGPPTTGDVPGWKNAEIRVQGAKYYVPMIELLKTVEKSTCPQLFQIKHVCVWTV